MRNYFLLLALAAAGCSSPAAKNEAAATAPARPTREQIEHNLISAKLKRELNNPASYQAASFMADGQVSKKDSVMLIGLTSESENPPPYMRADSAKAAGQRYQHKFRATNEAGGLVLMDRTAIVYPNDSVLILSF